MKNLFIAKSTETVYNLLSGQATRPCPSMDMHLTKRKQLGLLVKVSQVVH